MDNNNTPSNTVALTVDQKYLAEAKPLEKTLKSGAIVARPMPLKQFRDKFGLTNKDAKRLHAAHWAQYDATQKDVLLGQLEKGFRFVRSSHKAGAHGERSSYTLSRTNSMQRETSKQVIARLEQMLSMANEKLSKLNAVKV